MQMLDVYQVQGIVKQAQAEFRLKFEQDHPDVVEFLAEKIIEAARNLDDSVTIFASDYKNVGNEKIGKYLSNKGFYITPIRNFDLPENNIMTSENEVEMKKHIGIAIKIPKS